MGIEKITESNQDEIAELMTRLKREWWTPVSAYNQIQKTIGWGIYEDKKPIGFCLIRVVEEYHMIEINAIGIEKNGMLSIDQRLSEVLVEVLHLAKNMNLANVMFVMGSHGFYCHGKPIENVSETIANLSINNRPEFNWLTKLGFTATGILPEIYGIHHHGIVLTLTVRCDMLTF